MMKSSREVVGLSSPLSHIPVLTDLWRSTVTPSPCQGPLQVPVWAPLVMVFTDRDLGTGVDEKKAKKEGRGGPKSRVKQGYFICRNACLYIFNKMITQPLRMKSISCNKKDSPVSKRSLKRLTKGSHWRESKLVPFPIISLLRTACSSAHSCIPVTDKEQSPWELAHKGRKCTILDPLKLNVPWHLYRADFSRFLSGNV